MMENEKHKKEIKKLETAAKRISAWAAANERTKIGFDPIKEHDRFLDTRCHIGAKTKKMQSRVKQMENRISKEIADKEDLLQDIEKPINLKIMPMKHYKEILVSAKEFNLSYVGGHKVLNNINIQIHQGERVFLHGKNGCGKSSFIKSVLAQQSMISREEVCEEGSLNVASGLIISYIDQDTSYLSGSLKKFCEKRGLEESLFNAILRQLECNRVQLSKNIEEYSEGQKKKVLIAASLLTPAHLYIWDEPLNYIDVFSRMQIEKLILDYQPTMILVEHDVEFQKKIATRMVKL